jgi:hypothetical protein
MVENREIPLPKGAFDMWVGMPDKAQENTYIPYPRVGCEEIPQYYTYYPPYTFNMGFIPAYQPNNCFFPPKPVFIIYDGRLLQNPVQNRQVGLLKPEERRKKIERYLKKKKTRCYSNRCYPCRREAANSRPRLHGRFVSKSSIPTTFPSSSNPSFAHEIRRPRRFFEIVKAY